MREIGRVGRGEGGRGGRVGFSLPSLPLSLHPSLISWPEGGKNGNSSLRSLFLTILLKLSLTNFSPLSLLSSPLSLSPPFLSLHLPFLFTSPLPPLPSPILPRCSSPPIALRLSLPLPPSPFQNTSLTFPCYPNK